MKLSSKLTQLALAGIASGLISTTALAEEGGTVPAKKDTAAHAKPAKKGKAVKAKTAMNDSAMSMDSSMTKSGPHGCKGQNTCKGMGNCSVSEKDLKDLASKSGIPMEKAGKAHGC